MENEKRSITAERRLFGMIAKPIRILCRNIAILLAAFYEVCLVETKHRYECTEEERK
ncbi:MAG: hypothetical protein K2H09_01355 [Treponemataceae bacterium]|nr:hypothetical protein [Treponemataceae bacterium]